MARFNLPNGRAFETELECQAYAQGLNDGYDKSKRMATDLLHTSVKAMLDGEVRSVEGVMVATLKAEQQARDDAEKARLAAVAKAKKDAEDKAAADAAAKEATETEEQPAEKDE